MEIIDKTYEAINSSLDGKNVDSNIWLKDLSARMERINRLRKKKDYLETIKCLDRDGLQEYFNLVGRMARELRLPIYRCFVDMEIAEEQELPTLYANGVVHERGKSIEIDQGMRIRFRLESKNQDAKQRVEVEWDKKRKGEGEQEGFYEALNDIKNMADTDSLDREFAFEQVGEYKVSAAVYKYMKKSLIKKIKTLAQEYEFTVIVNEGEELYEGMEFKDKLWEALSAVDWKGVVQDSMFDVTSQLPIMVGTIVLLSGVLIAISMSPIGWLAPLVGTAMQVFGLSGAVEDVVKGIYMFTDAILRIRDAKSKAGMMQATQHLEESFRQVAPSLMLDVLLFLGGKRVTKNPSGSDLVREVPRTKLASISKVDGSGREIRINENSAVKRIGKQVEVKCKIKEVFDTAKYHNQLRNQEEALNNLTIQEYLGNIENYKKNGRGKEATKIQKKVRADVRRERINELRREGKSKIEAETLVDEWLRTQAALHNPDMSAGGSPFSVTGVGDARINSSIGSQWRNGRATFLEMQIRESIKSIDPKDYTTIFLNVKLTTE